MALPIYTRLTHHRVTRWEWMWAALLAVALAVFITVGDPQAGRSHGSLHAWWPWCRARSWCYVCAGSADLAGRLAAAVLLAVVAGSAFAVFPVLTKGVVEALRHGFGAAQGAPEFYAWIPARLPQRRLALDGTYKSPAHLRRRRTASLVARPDLLGGSG